MGIKETLKKLLEAIKLMVRSVAIGGASMLPVFVFSREGVVINGWIDCTVIVIWYAIIVILITPVEGSFKKPFKQI